MSSPKENTPTWNNEMLSQLWFALYRLNYRVQTPMLLPEYKGSVFRGALGYQLKRISPEVYAQIFDTTQVSLRRAATQGEPSPFLANIRDVPHPYVLEPPLTSQRFFEPGEELQVHLILIGEAVDYLPFLVFALSEAGRQGLGNWIDNRRGTCMLESIESLKAWEEETPIVVYSGEERRLSDESVILTLDAITTPIAPDGRCSLEFLTPTRLKVKGHLTAGLSFDVLLGALTRRITILAYYYCGLEVFFSPQLLNEKARLIRTVPENTLEWVDWERHSARQETKLRMGGFQGMIHFEGRFDLCGCLLLLGEYLHVGKGTSLGLGKYRIR